jgi:hypothetical protein
MIPEEKAKRYDEALEELRGLLEGIREEKCKILEEDITSIFPELKENEDEKVRKMLIRFFEAWNKTRSHCWGISVPKILAWLEKQGEQKPQGKTALEAINEEKVDNANKVEHKPAWSEEDEEILSEIIYFFEKGIPTVQHDFRIYVSWLKSLKDRVQPQQEWSEEDKKIIDRIESEFLALYRGDYKNIDFNDVSSLTVLKWARKIKSLRFQNTWKPSDEQMNTLRHVISGCSYDIEPLVEMEEQLKKLRGE